MQRAEVHKIDLSHADQSYRAVIRHDVEGALLGVGSFGAVYRITWNGRDAALKIPRAANPATIQREISEEIKFLGALNHPNIIKVYASFNDAIVFELASNQNLQKQLANPNVTSAKLRQYLLGVAQGLAYLHQQGVLHRDIKPDNILISSDDRALIADFGTNIAARGAFYTVFTSTFGITTGTAAYMAPETLLRHRQVKASDVYALGLMMLLAETREIAPLITVQSAQQHGKLRSGGHSTNLSVLPPANFDLNFLCTGLAAVQYRERDRISAADVSRLLQSGAQNPPQTVSAYLQNNPHLSRENIFQHILLNDAQPLLQKCIQDANIPKAAYFVSTTKLLEHIRGDAIVEDQANSIMKMIFSDRRNSQFIADLVNDPAVTTKMLLQPIDGQNRNIIQIAVMTDLALAKTLLQSPKFSAACMQCLFPSGKQSSEVLQHLIAQLHSRDQARKTEAHEFLKILVNHQHYNAETLAPALAHIDTLDLAISDHTQQYIEKDYLKRVDPLYQERTKRLADALRNYTQMRYMYAHTHYKEAKNILKNYSNDYTSMAMAIKTYLMKASKDNRAPEIKAEGKFNTQVLQPFNIFHIAAEKQPNLNPIDKPDI